MSIMAGIIIIILVFIFGIVGVFFSLLKEIFAPQSQQSNARQNATHRASARPKQKLIDKNEGEYVDFEEV